ncbi:MAG: S41 family peptidase [Bacteroidales bacterium]|nr:S41 family peptidase [Bacteroidales bacterium]
MNSNTTTSKFATLLYLLNNYYVDTLNMPNIVDKAIVSTLRDLDPHSVYIPAKDVKEAEESLKGSFEGIGVTFQIFKDTILVIAPVQGGPSDKVGIMAGDKIVTINGKSAVGPKINNEWVMDHLRGKKGTKVDVGVYRNGVGHIFDFTITRDRIPLNSLDASFMIDKHTGYIRLGRFAETSKQEFDKAFDSLKKQGLKNLIFDLRGNPGGYLETAQEIASEFLSSGKLIVYTQGIHSPRQELYSSGQGDFRKGKLIVLIDEGTASASEIVSGALQYWDRALIVGRLSFGKGLVQRPFFLPDGSLIRLTIARYYTPSGRWIQRPFNKGITAYYNDWQTRLKHGELFHADSIHFPDSLKFHTHNGRVVYGGGGIMPDIFIPFDSTRFDALYTDLVVKGIFNNYVNDYLNSNGQNLKQKYPHFKQFLNHFSISKSMFNNFLDDARKAKIEINPKALDPNVNFIKLQIKALIARDLFDENAYFEVILPSDSAIKRSLQLLNGDKAFDKLKINY